MFATRIVLPRLTPAGYYGVTIFFFSRVARLRSIHFRFEGPTDRGLIDSCFFSGTKRKLPKIVVGSSRRGVTLLKKMRATFTLVT